MRALRTVIQQNGRDNHWLSRPFSVCLRQAHTVQDCEQYGLQFVYETRVREHDYGTPIRAAATSDVGQARTVSCTIEMSGKFSHFGILYLIKLRELIRPPRRVGSTLNQGGRFTYPGGHNTILPAIQT